jgi:hypothetical protein
LVDWEDVSDCQTGFLAAVNVLSAVHSFGGDEVFRLLFESVRVSESYFGQRSSSSGIMDNFFDHSLYVPVSLGEVQITELRLVQPVMVVSFENTLGVSPSLVSDYSTHYDFNKLIY